ncbi:MAG: folylpolyglutamate synthase/dihydrofolate synthase family protein [Microbacteriaceae bacterium]|nr:folylpolyglutamate synthase/dihydrofolate synthase family protein [Microbacteriaceae bacterium]
MTANNSENSQNNPGRAQDPWEQANAEAGFTTEHAKAEAAEVLRMLNPLLDDGEADSDSDYATPVLDDSYAKLEDSVLELESSQAARRVYEEMLPRMGEAHPRPRIAPVRRFAELAGTPQKSYPIIQVGGTNGKTSTSRTIESLLRSQGLTTGLFTSPHLVDFNERFCISGEPVDGGALLAAWNNLQPALAAVDAELEAAGERTITFFEALAVLGFEVFADAPVDVAVIEVGLGGEWDATNICDADVAVITPIALDHVAVLGNSIAGIAQNKAGIIKPGTQVVCSKQVPEARTALAASAAEKGAASIRFAGEDFILCSNKPVFGGRLIEVRGLYGEVYSDLVLPLMGEHQGENATLAIAAIEAFLGRSLDAQIALEGIAGATSPGRLQVIGTEPAVLVDAAHNPHGAAALQATLNADFAFTETALVVGVLADKDVDEVLQCLVPLADRVYLVPVTSPRAMSLSSLYEISENTELFAGREVSVCATDKEGFAAAYEWAQESDGRGVIIAGSVVLAGCAISYAQAEGWRK